jgi:hypothetical protein
MNIEYWGVGCKGRKKSDKEERKVTLREEKQREGRA